MNGKLALFAHHLVELRAKFREKVDDGTAKKLLSYLVQFGYLSPEKLADIETLWKALGILRDLLGFDEELPEDDILRSPFLDKLLTAPRCGCPDHFEFAASPKKWGKRELNYKIIRYVDGLTNNEQDSIIEQAFRQWSDVCDVKFEQAKRTDLLGIDIINIVISAGIGTNDHFDGPFGTLAWAYLPSSPNFFGQLHMKFDLSETWSDSPSERGILMLNVACHEIGHLLGLEHSSVRGALMAPFYDPNIAKPVQRDDISRIVGLYGHPKPPALPPIIPPSYEVLRPEHFTEEGKRVLRSWFQ